MNKNSKDTNSMGNAIFALFTGMNLQQVMWILAFIGTMGLQWGVVSTRLSSLKEDAIPAMSKKLDEQAKDIEALKIDNGILKVQVQDLKERLSRSK
jgi:hypothetical protein